MQCHIVFFDVEGERPLFHETATISLAKLLGLYDNCTTIVKFLCNVIHTIIFFVGINKLNNYRATTSYKITYCSDRMVKIISTLSVNV